MSDAGSQWQGSPITSRRSSKRRRLEGYDSQTSTPEYTSSDELENHGDHKYSKRRSSHDRQTSLPYHPVHRNRSLSPEELDHTFYRKSSVDGYSDRSDRSRRRTSTPRSTRSSIPPDTAPTPPSPTPPPPKPKDVRYKLKHVLEGHKQ